MSGIYFHIPYCKQACYYCDFHFSTNRNTQREMVRAMTTELEMRNDFLQQPVETIYFGGGTPSLLEIKQIAALLEKVYALFKVERQAEITLEANPDDVTKENLSGWKSLGINRLSIGIQTFQQKYLHYMNRVHDTSTAQKAVELAQSEGFHNINLDLIYGIPHQTLQELYDDLLKFVALRPQHISAYCLTIEEKTVFGNLFKKRKLTPLSDEETADFFVKVSQFLTQNGFEHYEVSNFCLPNYYSRHNASYWQSKPYLGIGPSAHSYDGNMHRYSNVSNNANYLQLIRQKILPFHIEKLSTANRINEYIMTSLRTKWGCNLKYLQHHFNYDLLAQKGKLITQKYLGKYLNIENHCIVLTLEGKLLANTIASELFLDDL
ncbi:MAG: radical SAM family heme chaperone HemW [Cytophagales bacterium]|nr:radical SAM family heme chaperone HemW [Cytophagales bacterium]MDW8383755.1 radical SAM family heme chaperone HemW [Flammeovirgaceae bacterium]